MTIKRKRALDFVDTPHVADDQPLKKRQRNSSPLLPLTCQNLRTFNYLIGNKSQPDMETPSRSTTSSSKKGRSTAASTDGHKSNLLLQAFNIREVASSEEKPPDVQELVEYVENIRDASEITPKSKKVASKHRETRHYSELKAFQILCGLLTYDDKTLENEEEGEDLIFIGPSDQWSDCVPRPSNMDQQKLQGIYQSLGAPSKPKPDSAHGYANYAIEKAGIIADIAGLPADAVPMRTHPWFPFLVCEYKSTKPMAEARRQAIKDAAAAIGCAHEALRFKTGREPPPGATAVFSLCVDPNLAEIRVHWRQPLPDGEIAWRAAVIGPDEVGIALLAREKEVFRLRSYVLKILEWAQTSRWRMFVEAMKQGTLTEPELLLPASGGLVTPPSSYVGTEKEAVLASQRVVSNKRRRRNSEHDLGAS